MTLNFVIPEMNIGGAGTPTLQFFRRGFNIGGDGGSTPTWQDVIISGNTALTLVNAKADGLNYLKLFGGCEQRELPSDYTQLNYIDTDSSAYIDIGVTPVCNVLHVKWKGQLLGNTYGGSMLGCVTSTTPRAGFRFFSNANNGNFNIQSYSSNIEETGVGFNPVTVDITYDNVNQTINGQINNSIISQTEANLNLNFNKNMLLGGAYIGDTAGSSTPNRHFYLTIEKDGVIVRNLIPAQRNSDNAIGMYDTVSETFLTNIGPGSFIAGDEVTPSPDNPINIVCNNGQIRKKNNLPAGYTQLVSITGATNRACFDTGVSGNNDNLRIKWKAQKETFVNYSPFFGNYRNESYNTTRSLNTAASTGIIATINRLASGSVNTNGIRPLELHEYEVYKEDGKSILVVDGNVVDRIANASGTANDTNIGFNSSAVLTAKSSAATTNTTFYYMQIYDGDTLIRNYVPVKNSNNVAGMYDTVNGTFKPAMFDVPFTAGDVDESAYGVYTDGTVETVKDSLDNTATAEMLLAVSENYRDVQEVLTGDITRNVAVKVLDGTETITLINNATTPLGYYFSVESADINHVAGSTTDIVAGHCTHFQNSVNGVLNLFGNGKYTTALAQNKFYFAIDVGANADNFKQWLAQQYQAGTPVILVYPLATPTTETATGQTLTTQQGTNIIEITQASIDGLPLEVSYKAGVTVTVEEVENANLDDSVTVTIGE